MNETWQAQLIQARRNHILEAAIDVIAEQGFQRTTIKQIASKAGVADGTIYNYFKNKDDILMGIIGQLSEAETRETTFAEAEQIDFQTFVTTFVSHRMAEMNSSFQALKVVLPETMMNAEIGSRVYNQIYAPMFAIAESYFQHLMDQGQIDTADPALMARLFASPLLGLIMLWLLGDAHVIANWENYSAAMIEFLLKAIKKNGESNEQ